jgi:hypothetical protein
MTATRPGDDAEDDGVEHQRGQSQSRQTVSLADGRKPSQWMGHMPLADGPAQYIALTVWYSRRLQG